MGVCIQGMNECECIFDEQNLIKSNNNEKQKINILWIDPNVNNEENSNYKEKLKNLGYSNIFCVTTIKEGLNILKSIKFEETFIIVSGGFYFQFTINFKEILREIYVIPKILVFTSRKKMKYLSNANNEILNKSFYNFGGYKILFEDIKNIIENQISNININYQLKGYNENEKKFFFRIL